MLATIWQGWQIVGKFANALPMFFQHLCKSRNYCSSKFSRIFSQFFNDPGPFSFIYRYPICQKNFYYDSANVGGILAQHRLPTSALCISTNTGPTLDASPRPTLLDKSFINY